MVFSQGAGPNAFSEEMELDSVTITPLTAPPIGEGMDLGWSYLSLFKAEYEDRFSRLCKSVGDLKAPYVIAIARKAPKLFALFHESRDRYVRDSLIVSDRALPFLSKKISGQRIPIVDDIVIFGSTMEDVVEEVRERGGIPDPRCLVLDREQAMVREIEPEIVLPSANVMAFTRQVADAFSLEGRPYDIDHPLLHYRSRLELDGETAEELGLADVTTRIQKMHGVENTVAQPSRVPNLSFLFRQRESIARIPLCKVRLFQRLKDKRLCLVPIVQLDLQEIPRDSEFFIFGSFNDLIEKARRIFHENKLKREQADDALHRLISFLLEFSLGIWFSAKVGGLRDDIEEPLLLPEELISLFGEFGEEIKKTLESEKGALLLLVQESCPIVGNGPRSLPERIENEALFNELFQDARHAELANSLSFESEVEVLLSICRLMHQKDLATRSPYRRRQKGRLKFGFSFEDLLRITRAKLGVADWRRLSLALDYLIDSGVVVPLFLRYAGGHFLRAFRFGENWPSAPETLRDHYVFWATDALLQAGQRESVSQFEWEKFFCFMDGVLGSRGWVASTGGLQSSAAVGERGTPNAPSNLPDAQEGAADITYQRMEVEKSFEEFGARPAIRSVIRQHRQGDSETLTLLVKEAQGRGVISVHAARTGTEIRLNRERCSKILVRSNPVDPIAAELSLFAGLWSSLCYEKQRPEINKEEIELLLSTCNTPLDFLRAYREGIYAWFRHPEDKFSNIISAMKANLGWTEERGEEVEGILRSINAARRRLAQHRKKESVWLRAPIIMEKIEEWAGSRPLAKGAWLMVRQRSLDLRPFSALEQTQFDILRNRLYPLAQALTEVVRALALEKTGQAESRLPESIQQHDTLVQEFQVAIVGLKPLGPVAANPGNEARMTAIVEKNYIALYNEFQYLCSLESTPKPESQTLVDVSLLIYDLKKFSDLTSRERFELTCGINESVGPFVRGLSVEQSYRPTHDDRSEWLFPDAEKALKSWAKLSRYLKTQRKGFRGALHKASPFDPIYRDNVGIFGGDAYITCARLVEKAEQLQRERERDGTLLLASAKFVDALPEAIRAPIISSPLRRIAVQGKSVPTVEYYELDEEAVVTRYA